MKMQKEALSEDEQDLLLWCMAPLRLNYVEEELREGMELERRKILAGLDRKIQRHLAREERKAR